jgi:hypothetical protein
MHLHRLVKLLVMGLVITACGSETAAPPPPAAAPTVSSVSPNQGSISGGISVTISGSGFVAVPTVTFGGTPATGVAFSSSNSILATVPANTPGAVAVVVTNPDGQSGTLASGYTYSAPPTVTGATPNTGGVAGGTAITIAGTGFAAGATVTVGGTAATGISVSSATSITATTPAHPAGAVDIVVTNPDAQSATLANGFTYRAPPTITSLNPGLGGPEGGTFVTIVGTGFVSVPAVSFGGTPATAVFFSSSTSVSAIAPAHAPGPATVVVTNPDNQSALLVNGFTYLAPPNPAAVSPNTGSTVGGTTVTVSGSGFVPGATVTFGGTAATGVTVTSANSITATTPAHAAGAVAVVVTNPNNQSGTLQNGFTYVAPTGPSPTAVTPNAGGTSGGTGVTITGTNFVTGATVTFGGTAATGVTVNSATSITATTPAHAAGAVAVVVTNPDNQFGTLQNGFTYVAGTGPVPTAVTPNTGSAAGGTTVTVSGTGFVAGATVTFGGSAGTNVTVNGPNAITVTTPPHAAGAVPVVVTNPDNQFGTLANGFTYQALPTQLTKTNWTVDLTYLGGSFTGLEVLINQAGSVLSGTTRDNNKEVDIVTSGTVTGSSVVVKFVLSNGGSPRGEFTCTGTIAGSPQEITGTFTSPDGGFFGGTNGVALQGNCRIR